MNLLFFLTPKSEIEFIYEDFTLRQTLEKMDYYRFSEIPVLGRDGQYAGTITEGDLLWYIKENKNLTLKDAENVPLSEIKRKRVTEAVSINVAMEQLVEKALNQNFVPVVDDNKTFIGIVKRQDLIRYCYDHMEK